MSSRDRSSWAVEGSLAAASTARRVSSKASGETCAARSIHAKRSIGTAVATRTRAAVSRGRTNADVRIARIRAVVRPVSQARTASRLADGARTRIDNGPDGFAL